MNIDQLLARFVLQPMRVEPHQAGYQHSAAVLVPLVPRGQQLSVLLTRRSAHLNHHPGQISFPGGRCESDDISIAATALREAEEEIGLQPEQVKIIGNLPHYISNSGFHIEPVVGLVKTTEDLNADPNEVDEIFEVPLAHFLEPQNHIEHKIKRHQQVYSVFWMPYQQYDIWGVTAGILHTLYQHVTAGTPPAIESH